MHKYRQRKKRSYSDEQRAQALAMLQAEGYPDNEGALTKVARAFGVPLTTLFTWQGRAMNAVSSDIRSQQTFNLLAVIDSEIERIFEGMQTKRKDASYRDLAIALGILTDKKQLLMGMPTSRTEHTHIFSEADKVSAVQSLLDKGKQRMIQGEVVSRGMPPADSHIPTEAIRPVASVVLPTTVHSVESREGMPSAGWLPAVNADSSIQVTTSEPLLSPLIADMADSANGSAAASQQAGNVQSVSMLPTDNVQSDSITFANMDLHNLSDAAI